MTDARAERQQPRVESLDLLRGLCAVGVAVYHVRTWLGLTTPHNLGLFGVYLFFVLSGVSMTVAYARRLERGYPMWKYLAARYVRLGPLYVAVALYMGAWEAATDGVSADLGFRFALNASLLFGLANPGESSMVGGGWSIGIEALFYFVLPLLIALRSWRHFPLLVAGAVALQLACVHHVLLGHADFTTQWVEYTQFGSFIGYFCAGVLIGHWVVERKIPSRVHPVLTWGLWGVLLGTILLSEGSNRIESLTGARGVVAAGASLGAVLVTVALRPTGVVGWAGRLLGDLSFGLYLMHPLVYGILHSDRVLGSVAREMPETFAAGVLMAAFVAALLTYRLFEKPILVWGKRQLAGRDDVRDEGAHRAA